MKSESATSAPAAIPISLMRRRLLQAAGFGLICGGCELTGAFGQEPARKPLRIVALGDSITKGVRPGVTADETFSAMLEKRAKAAGFAAEVVNVGIGGERTDQALARLDRDVIAKSPAIVLVMYGANDSYVDPGQKSPRLSPDQFRANLVQLVDRSRAAGIEVVLMTEPRYGTNPRPNGLGEHPNQRLAEFMMLVREVAREKKTGLVDHFEEWSRKEAAGLDIATVTTDLLHPNPAGHKILADSIWPVLEPMLKGQNAAK